MKMKPRSLQPLLKFSALACSALFASVPRAADLPGNTGVIPLATGQYITPTFVSGAVQQYLNPRLPAYPDFVAGEAVRSQLSADGSLDTANSTQYIFLYNVAGANKSSPVLAQVIQQTNAHVGLVFSPDSNT